MIPMHGGLPPANTFPFTSFTCGLLPLSDASNSSSSSSNTINQAPAGAGAAAGDLREGSSAVVQQQQPQKEEQEEGHGVGGSSSSVLAIDDPALVCAAQQYNMHAPVSLQGEGGCCVHARGAGSSWEALLLELHSRWAQPPCASRPVHLQRRRVFVHPTSMYNMQCTPHLLQRASTPPPSCTPPSLIHSGLCPAGCLGA